jgi:hypothetical protein
MIEPVPTIHDFVVDTLLINVDASKMVSSCCLRLQRSPILNILSLKPQSFDGRQQDAD